MGVLTSIKELTAEVAAAEVDAGGAFIDVRPVAAYLDVHVPGSLSLQYEFGPGFPGRARDCIPLEIPLVLLAEEGVDAHEIAGALRGKGFAVIGVVPGGVGAWGERFGSPASTEVVDGPRPIQGAVVHVGDPGAPHVDNATRIPIENMWASASRFAHRKEVTIAAGKGVRAALAVGMLERAGVSNITFWRCVSPLPSLSRSRTRGLFQ